MHCLLNFSKPISNFDIIILAVDFMETLCGFEGFKMTSYVAWFWTIHFFKYISIWIRNFVPSSKLCLLAHFTAAYKLDQRRGSVVWIFSVVHRMMEATIIFQNTRKLIELQIVKMDLFSQNLWSISYGWHGWIAILIFSIKRGKTRSIGSGWNTTYWSSFWSFSLYRKSDFSSSRAKVDIHIQLLLLKVLFKIAVLTF